MCLMARAELMQIFDTLDTDFVTVSCDCDHLGCDVTPKQLLNTVTQSDLHQVWIHICVCHPHQSSTSLTNFTVTVSLIVRFDHVLVVILAVISVASPLVPLSSTMYRVYRLRPGLHLACSPRH